MRYLNFKGNDADGGNEADQRRFALMQLTFQRADRRNSPNDLQVITDLISRMNVVGVMPDDDDEEGSTDPDSVVVAEPMRRLADKGGRVKLETNQHKMLRELIDSTPWKPSFAPNITDLKQWLSKAPKDRKSAQDDMPGDDLADSE